METAVDYKVLYEQQVKHTEALQVQLAQLTHQLSELQRLIFGSRHERFQADHHNPNQLHFDIEAEQVAASIVASAQRITYTPHHFRANPRQGASRKNEAARPLGEKGRGGGTFRKYYRS